VLRLAPALAGIAAAGCLYTGPINDRPRAEIEKLTPGPYHYPRQVLEFTARKSSDREDGGGISCTWSAFTCTTEGGAESCAPLGESVELPPDGVFRPPAIPSHDPVVVQLQVRDRSGAVSRDTMRIEVGNRPPGLQLQVNQGAQAPGTTESYVVTVPIEISLRDLVDPDGDEVSVTWQLADRPAGSDPNQVEWGPVGTDSDTYRLVPDAPGVWRIEVTASDGFEQGTTTVTEQIPVDEDQAPCIALTAPAAPAPGRHVLSREDGPRRFAVLAVTDDLDPYPRPPRDSPYLGAAELSWSLAGPQTGGALVPLAGAGGGDVVIDPAAHAPGDRIELRVEARDRVDRALPCDPSAPTCSIGGDGCLQRVSWEVEIR